MEKLEIRRKRKKGNGKRGNGKRENGKDGCRILNYDLRFFF
jgi:hypothetical protein